MARSSGVKGTASKYRPIDDLLSNAWALALGELREAVATYATRAAEKLRQQQSLCSLLHVGIRTGLFNTNEERVSLSVTCHLPYPTDDTRLLVQSAIAGLDQIYKAGPAYAKASVMLIEQAP